MTAEEILSKKEFEWDGYLTTYLPAHAIEAMKEYAKLKCEEQRNICADELEGDYFDRLGYGLKPEVILNAHFPEFD